MIVRKDNHVGPSDLKEKDVISKFRRGKQKLKKSPCFSGLELSVTSNLTESFVKGADKKVPMV